MRSPDTAIRNVNRIQMDGVMIQHTARAPPQLYANTGPHHELTATVPVSAVHTHTETHTRTNARAFVQTHLGAVHGGGSAIQMQVLNGRHGLDVDRNLWQLHPTAALPGDQQGRVSDDLVGT